MDIQKKLFIHSVELLSRRPYHSAELRIKLAKKAEKLQENLADLSEDGELSEEPPPISDQIEAVISKLLEYRYIDDQEYLKAYIENQQRTKPQGALLIKQKLRQKGIPTEQFENVLKQDQSEQIELAKVALQKKLRTLQAKNQRQKKEKAFRFLQSRGFSATAILRAMETSEL